MSIYDETARNRSIQSTENMFVGAPMAAKHGTRTFVAAVLNQLIAMWRAVKGRWVLRTLSELDDHMLRDIGLTRTDVRSASAVSLLQDPTAQFNYRACGRDPSRYSGT